jgi:uncharacterized membrane protein YedE/YeeE
VAVWLAGGCDTAMLICASDRQQSVFSAIYDARRKRRYALI